MNPAGGAAPHIRTARMHRLQARCAMLLIALTALPAPRSADAVDETQRAAEAAFDRLNREAATAFGRLQQQADAAFAAQEQAWRAYTEAQQRAFARYKAEIEAIWGAEQSRLPGRKKWVSYGADHRSRTTVDFERGKVEVDLLLEGKKPADESQIRRRLADRLAAAIARPAREDPLLEVPAPPGAATSHRPILPLAGELKTTDGTPVDADNAAAFARRIAARATIRRKRIQTPAGEKGMVSLTLPLPPDHMLRRAERFRPQVEANAARWGLPAALVFGVIETESAFNPMARSNVPAFGLMQLVPRTGARDAYRKVYGEDKIVTPEYLYDPDHNIALGTAYLALLQSREMRRIRDPQSRLFCTIAAYNTGGGNVARAFIPGSRNIQRAAARINRMRPDQVFQQLRTRLPYPETRDYVVLVRNRMARYRAWER
ncbi:MAG: DUF3393 domain-containing protein [Zetaproteobacteria bacterium]|nr:MAG: DUF3393 domain-containing protein [Zetaproteobacteria bacterium]